MRNKKTLLLSILLVLALFKWMQQKKAVHQISIIKEPVTKVAKEPYVNSEFKRFVTKCPSLRKFEQSDIQENEELARNIHYRKSGEVFRLRIFIEDADNGSYRKLVHYKEDADGFPQILKLPEGKEIGPTDTYIQSFLSSSEIIHREKDYRLKLKDGRELRVSEQNGVITKLSSNSDDCFFDQ